MRSSIVAGIFVGGQGRRMGGVAKGLLVAPGGETIIVRHARILEGLGIASVLVGAHAAYAACGLERIEDDPCASGPLGGLIALLEHARARPGEASAIAVACDMPYVSDRLLARLRDAPPAPIVSARRSDFWEPFFARYEPGPVIAVARARAASGMTALQGLLDACAARALDLTPEERDELRDWDTPVDMAGGPGKPGV